MSIGERDIATGSVIGEEMSFAAEEKSDILLITCPAVMGSAEAAGVEEQFKTWATAKPSVVVFDMKGVTELKSTIYRHLVLFNQQLKANGKGMFCTNVPAKIEAQIKTDGLTGVLVTVASPEAALKAMQGRKEKQAVDVDFINPFMAATQRVLETQANTPLVPGKAYIKKPEEQIVVGIAGVISLNCAEFKGTISICFRPEVFLKIYENMVGEKHTEITSETQDAAGELLNIIFGQAKTILNDHKGFNIDKAIPTVLVGEKLRLHHSARSPALILPFDSKAGTFHLEVVVDRH